MNKHQLIALLAVIKSLYLHLKQGTLCEGDSLVQFCNKVNHVCNIRAADQNYSVQGGHLY
jgi:hypothetical protein